MSFVNYNYIPNSDIALDDSNAISTYKNQVNLHNYTDAVSSLNTNSLNKGFRASKLNNIEECLVNVGTQVLLMTKYQDTVFAITEPTDDQMSGKLFWMQEY